MRYVALTCLFAFLFGIGLLIAIPLTNNDKPATAVNASNLDYFKEFDSNMQASSLYVKWKRSNPGESSKYESFANAIKTGQSPAPPVVATSFGKALIAAGKMALSVSAPIPPTTTAPTTTAAAGSLYLSPSGSDTSSCTQSSPCKSFSRALSVATAGSVVSVAPGDYPGETLTGNKQVTFVGSGARVVGSRMTLSNLHNVTFKGISYSTNDPYRDIMFEACNSDLTLDGVTAKKFTMLEGNTNVTIKNSSFGGYGTPGDTVDNVIGTAGATGPTRNCNGALAGPASNIMIDNVRFHDVFWGVAQSQWSGAHPDCFEINGYVNGVTIQNSEFDHCVDSFMGLYTDQGDTLNVTFKNNRLHDGGTPSYYAIQNVCSGSNGYKGGNIVFQGNTFDTNPNAFEPYPSLRVECVAKAGYAAPLVEGNTFKQGPPVSECSVSRASPYNTIWRNNTFTEGSACPPEQPAPSNPSGEAMPTGDLAGWRQIFTDDFTANVPLGSFLGGKHGQWNPYPYPWQDTSKHGTYWPEHGLSVHDGIMDVWLHTETVNGVAVHVVNAPQPILPGTSRGQLYGRYVIRFKSDPVPGYKTAWLLWPDSGLRTDGEIDFPEGNLDSTIHAFMHRQDAASGSDQDAYSTGISYTSWHTAVIEWLPSRCTFILDGKVIGNSTSRIPATPMHYVIQTETVLGSVIPSNSAQGHVSIDWVAVYAKV